MLYVGDYVMINRNAYGSCYCEELDELFNKVGRVIKVEVNKRTMERVYKLDITRKYSFPFAFTERFLINLNEGI